MRSLKFSDEAWNDYLFWQEHDKRILKRLNELLKACQRTPFEGLGKPEGSSISSPAYGRAVLTTRTVSSTRSTTPISW